MSVNVYFDKEQALKAGGVLCSETVWLDYEIPPQFYTTNVFKISAEGHNAFTEYSNSPTGDTELCCNFRKGGTIRSILEPWLIVNNISYRTDEELG